MIVYRQFWSILFIQQNNVLATDCSYYVWVFRVLVFPNRPKYHKFYNSKKNPSIPTISFSLTSSLFTFHPLTFGWCWKFDNQFMCFKWLNKAPTPPLDLQVCLAWRPFFLLSLGEGLGKATKMFESCGVVLFVVRFFRWKEPNLGWFKVILCSIFCYVPLICEPSF